MSRLEKLREDLEKRALLPNDPDSEWLIRVAETADEALRDDNNWLRPSHFVTLRDLLREEE